MDVTSVTITPKVTLPGGTGVAAALANTATTYTFDAGQYVEWQDTGDMAGSVIESTNPSHIPVVLHISACRVRRRMVAVAIPDTK